MPHILITNDDGVFASGLLSLAQEMRRLGKISILAPDHNWSGGGHVKTLDRALNELNTWQWDGKSDSYLASYVMFSDQPFELKTNG